MRAWVPTVHGQGLTAGCVQRPILSKQACKVQFLRGLGEQATLDEDGDPVLMAAASPEAPPTTVCISLINGFDLSFLGLDAPPLARGLLGVPFMQAYYTVYRRDGPGQASVGFAASV